MGVPIMGRRGYRIARLIALVVVAGIVLWQSRNAGPGRSPSPRSGGETSSQTSPVPELRESDTPTGPQPPARSATARSSGATAASKTAPPPKSGSLGGRTETLRVGAWNIEWLGKPEDRSGAGQNVPQDPQDLARTIVDSKVAVLAVEEIVTRVKGDPARSRELEAVIAAIKQNTNDQWDYVLFPGRAEGDQLTGVLWNTARVKAINSKGAAWEQPRDVPWMLPIPKARSAQGSYLWNRPPHAMKFSAGDGLTDFVVIVLHMKADYQGDFAQHRREEAQTLVAALPEVRRAFKDDDIILLGDTNCVQDHEPAIDVFESAGFVDLNARKLQTHWRGGTMDRALTPTAQPEFATRTFEVMGEDYLRSRGLTPRDYKKRYSDHFLVATDLAVMPDDD